MKTSSEHYVAMHRQGIEVQGASAKVANALRTLGFTDRPIGATPALWMSGQKSYRTLTTPAQERVAGLLAEAEAAGGTVTYFGR